MNGFGYISVLHALATKASIRTENGTRKRDSEEPANSPVYSGGQLGKHKIIGVGPGFITENFQRSRQNIDEIVLVEDEAAFDCAGRSLAAKAFW